MEGIGFIKYFGIVDRSVCMNLYLFIGKERVLLLMWYYNG